MEKWLRRERGNAQELGTEKNYADGYSNGWWDAIGSVIDELTLRTVAVVEVVKTRDYGEWWEVHLSPVLLHKNDIVKLRGIVRIILED